MWSGPRNLSTAMMRAFSARADCAVWDEPFYAAYLLATGIDHPMREEIIASHETDPEIVAAGCAGPAPGGKALFYQKHMTHHMVDGFDLSWTSAVRSAFLIRDPDHVAASYEAKREGSTLADLGYERQSQLFEMEAERLGRTPPVIDAARISADPAEALKMLCEALAITYDPAMLSWAPGPKKEDGVWGDHWYEAVNTSTGLGRLRTGSRPATEHARRLADQARPFYDHLARHAL